MHGRGRPVCLPQSPGVCRGLRKATYLVTLSSMKETDVKVGAMIYSFGPAIRSGQVSLRETIELCAELGLACVDTMNGLGGDAWLDVRKMVEDAGMFVACHIASTDLATLDDAQRGENIEAMRACVDDTLALGADKLMLVTGSIPEGSDRATAQGRVGEGLAAIIENSRGSGVQICIEDFPGERSPHRTSQELAAVLEIAGPDLGVCFDTGNFYSGGETPEEAWPNLASTAIHCHAKDWAWADEGRHSTPDGKRFNPELVGRGIIDYPAVIALMKASHYAGIVSFEYEGALDRVEAAREGIAYLRSLCESTGS